MSWCSIIQLILYHITRNTDSEGHILGRTSHSHWMRRPRWGRGEEVWSMYYRIEGKGFIGGRRTFVESLMNGGIDWHREGQVHEAFVPFSFPLRNPLVAKFGLQHLVCQSRFICFRPITIKQSGWWALKVGATTGAGGRHSRSLRNPSHSPFGQMLMLATQGGFVEEAAGDRHRITLQGTLPIQTQRCIPTKGFEEEGDKKFGRKKEDKEEG